MNGQVFKLIFKGSLDFGKEKSYETAKTLFLSKVEQVYKSDMLFLLEESFCDETMTMVVPQLYYLNTDKAFKATTSLLKLMAEYSIAGCIYAWMVDSGSVLKMEIIEPVGQKEAVQEYLRGRTLISTRGKEEEAASALTRAIEKYAKHALAYERRGITNYYLKNYKDAFYDFSKSIDINPSNGDPYYGRAKIRIINGELDKAIEDFSSAINRTVPLLAIYHRAFFNRGECYYQLGKFAEAEKDLAFYLNRKHHFDADTKSKDTRAFQILGTIQLEKNEFVSAIESFTKAIMSKPADVAKLKHIERDALYARGYAKYKAGKKEYMPDLKAAAELGSTSALEFLKEIG